jgi:hypothetical protein
MSDFVGGLAANRAPVWTGAEYNAGCPSEAWWSVGGVCVPTNYYFFGPTLDASSPCAALWFYKPPKLKRNSTHIHTKLHRTS